MHLRIGSFLFIVFCMSTVGLRTWVEIDRMALRRNCEAFRALAGDGVKVMTVVKSNAYGCDLVLCAVFLESCGVQWFGVDSVVEGLALRKAGVSAPILVLGYTLPERVLEARDASVSITISNFDALDHLSRLNLHNQKKLRVHVKVDTGMHRHGFFVEDIPKVVCALKVLSGVEVEGVFSHFAAAVPSRRREAEAQVVRFREAVDIFSDAGFSPMRHMGATGGALCFPDAHFDCVRVGIGTYGLWPSDEARERVDRTDGSHVTLTPALSWKTVVAEVKEIPKGSGVSYDWTETVSRDSRIAVLPIGYWHGYPRALSSVGEVLIHGGRAKVLGRVCMDIMMVDVTDIPDVNVGDEVVLLGRQGGEEVSAYELAERAGTIPYEIITQINPRTRRVYVE
jgi:alanine racemase